MKVLRMRVDMCSTVEAWVQYESCTDAKVILFSYESAKLKGNRVGIGLPYTEGR